jgi:adiponectin receptor
MDSNDTVWIDSSKTVNSAQNVYIKNKLTRWPVFVFLISAIVCLSFSAIYHLFFVQSQKLSALLGRLDYIGISFLIAGSCFPPYYYFYYCSTSIYLLIRLELMIFYLSFTSLFASIVLVFSLREDFASSSKRGIRGFLFLSLGLSAAIPMFHLAFFGKYIHGTIVNPTLINWVFGGFCYIIGCLIYIYRIPEKIWPGKFCIWGSSHQIWHCLVFAGILFHFFGCVDTYNDRLSNMYC